jgi:hypothetical protein
MAKKEPSKVWLWWFQASDNILGLKDEIEVINRQIEAEKEHHIRGEDVYKLMIRKKILLQSKIRLLEERNVANG